MDGITTSTLGNGEGINLYAVGDGGGVFGGEYAPDGTYILPDGSYYLTKNNEYYILGE